MKRNEIKDQIMYAANADGVTFHKDGRITARRSYFYRFGMTPEKFAEKVKAAVPGVTIIEAYDDWQQWPKTSYFKVVFRMPKVA